jgi:hypothetical protein
MSAANALAKLMAHLPEGRKLQEAPNGKSYDKAFQDQKPAGYNYKRVTSGAGRDGLKVSTEKVAYYDKVAPKAAPAPAPAPAAAPPPPPPKEQSLAIEPVKHSPEIEQAKERANAYEDKSKSKSSSAWDQAQATVQSSFIKPTSSNLNQEVDFSSDSFQAKEASEPKEQAQAAQNQMQNYISKYSQYKSSS